MIYKLRVDEEFKHIAPPLSRSEYEELEKSIIAEGCREPITIWDNVILDGHNRYQICRQRDIPFNVRSLHVDSREEAIAWICSNQLGRRNITEASRQYLIGKRFEAEKTLGDRNPNGYNQYIQQKELSPQNRGKPLACVSKYGIAANLGLEYGVAHSTIERYGKYAEAIDQIKEANDDFASSILSGRIIVNQHDVLDMAGLNDQQIRAVARDVPRASHFRLEREQIIDSVRTVRRPASTPAQSQRPQTDLTISTVKDLPSYDPDAEVASLTLTMPSWGSSINRVRQNSKMESVSRRAKNALQKELEVLQSAIDMMNQCLSED